MKSFISKVVAVTCLVSNASAQFFGAVPRAPHLHKRGLSGLEPRYDDINLYFTADEESKFSNDSMVVKVVLEPKLPVMLLDETEPSISRMSCTRDGMSLTFPSPQHFNHARIAMARQNPFAIITSKSGCAEPNVHQAYKIHSVEYLDTALTAILSTERSTLRKCSHQVHTDIGSQYVGDVDKTRIFKRSLVPDEKAPVFSSSPVPQPSSTSSPSGTAPIGPIPTETGVIDFAYLNTALIPPSPMIKSLLNNLGFPLNLEVDCVNCTANGLMTLTGGGFSLHDNPISTVKDFIENGYLDFRVDHFSAYIEMLVGLLPGIGTQKWTPAIPPIPILGISIPHIATFGLVLNCSFPMTFSLLDPVNVTSGFQMQIPDGSEIRIGIGDDDQSTQKGFDQTMLTPIPLKVDRGDLAFGFTAAFRPELNLMAQAGKEDLPFDVDGQVGVFMDLPKLNVTLDPMTNVDSSCAPAAAGAQSYANALEILPSVVIDGGYDWGIDFKIPVLPDFDIHRSKALLSKTWSLPNQCLTFGDPGAPAAAPKPATGSSSSAAAPSVTSVSTVPTAVSEKLSHVAQAQPNVVQGVRMRPHFQNLGNH